MACTPVLDTLEFSVTAEIPVAEIEEADRELRAEIIAKVIDERNAINRMQHIGAVYHIGQIVFGRLAADEHVVAALSKLTMSASVVLSSQKA